MTMKTTRWMWWMVAGLIVLSGCGEAVEEEAELEPIDDSPALGGIYDGPGPGDEVLALDGKFDDALPASFRQLMEVQSPVRNQRSRGVCSIFSTIGLMESLYIQEGTIKNPDFSEQYLQWSSKVKGGFFPMTSGSSARANLESINRFGVPFEEAWPYEPTQWNTSNDERCNGDEKTQPTICYTNGDAPQSAQDAAIYKVGKLDWVSTSPNSMKMYMFKQKRPIIIGVDFFYQAWSHGGSKLGINQDNKRVTAVVYPSQADIADSKLRPAGHSVLVVGWDDNLEFPRLDEKGQPLKDANGNVIKEKGFYIIKNSWGTSNSNPEGSGYAYISYRYVQDFGNAMSAAKPTNVPKPNIAEPEKCEDGKDNDLDGKLDCEDTDCASAMACMKTNSVGGEVSPNLSIPDNDSKGVESVIRVEGAGKVKGVKVSVDITHTWIGDLDVILVHPDGDLHILQEAGDSNDKNLKKTWEFQDFNGKDVAGAWKLLVIDNAKQDTGKINRWSLEIAN